MTTVLDPRYWVEQESGLLVPQPEQRSITYPGNDAWLELEANVAGPTNAIVNPGIEADTSGWAATSGATITRVTGEHHSGLAALQVVVSTAATDLGTYYQVACQAGQDWHAGVWVKGAAGLALSLHIWNNGTSGRTDFTTDGTWQYIQADATTAGSDTSLLMYVKTRTAATATFYVDDAHFASAAWAMVETVPDSGGKPNKTVTIAPGTTNNPTVSTAQSKFGGASLLFPNLNLTALQTPNHADFNFGAGDFTIEAWCYITTARKALYALRAGTSVDLGWEMTMDAGSVSAQVLTFYYALAADSANFAAQCDWSFTANLNQWYHLAVVRSGATLMAFIDGVKQGTTYSMSGITIRDSAAPLTIGGDNRSAGGNDYRGYLDEQRISKGIARWTATFSVPTAAYTRDQYTSLLMHGDGTDGTQVYTDSSGVPATPFDPGSDPAWVEIER